MEQPKYKINLEKKNIYITCINSYTIRIYKKHSSDLYSNKTKLVDSSITLYKSHNNYILPGAYSVLTMYDNILPLLKKTKFGKILMDIKDYKDELISDIFISKEAYEKALVFKNPYKSTNGSNMTLVMIDLNKVKLNEIKIR